MVADVTISLRSRRLAQNVRKRKTKNNKKKNESREDNIPCHDVAQQAKEDICVERALVCLVHDDDTILVKVSLIEALAQKDTIRHVLDDCLYG